MPGKNFGLRHSCRENEHFFADCLVNCFEVKREMKNKEKLFNCCNTNCKYWEWVDEGESSDGSSTATVYLNNHAALEEVQQFSCIFQSLRRITEEQNINISLNVTISMANGKKGKGLA